jgi:hypothetical protein
MSRLPPCALLVLLLACTDGEPAEPASGACEPFGATAEPVELGTVLGAGRDGAGASYVVDQTEDGELRAFSGSAMTLTQSRVAGAFEMNEPSLQRYAVSVEVLPRSYTLIVERAGDTTRMARTFSVERLAIDDLSPSEVLENVAVEALQDVEVRSAPGDVEVEYFAGAQGGELLLVVKPPNSVGFEDFRLFYGQPDALRERELISVTRQRDGGTTTIVFELDGEEAEAFFPIQFENDMFLPGQPTLQQGGDVAPLERFDSPADAERLEGARFECLG